MRGHLHEARTRLDRVLAMPASRDHPESRGRALEAAGGIAYWQADMQAARVFYDENLELARAGADPKTIADALYNASFPLLVGRIDVDKARALLAEAMPIYERLGDRAALGRCKWALGNSYWFNGQFAEAVAPLDEAIEQARETGDRFSYGWALHTRALLAIDMKDGARAKPLIEEAMGIFSGVGDISGMSLILADFADLAMLEGDRERAARILGAALAQEKRAGTGLGSLVNVLEGRALFTLTTDSDEALKAEGQAWPLERAIAYALREDLHPKVPAV
jgi:non-specific serine/threonine protein kinase